MSVLMATFKSPIAPPSTETLQRRSFGEELPEVHVAGHIWLGAYARDKNTCARTLVENVGGLICEGGRLCGTQQ